MVSYTKARTQYRFFSISGDIMIQCKDCEFYDQTPDGRRTFKCDPFTTIKESECLAKWHLLRLDMLLAGFRGMTSFQEKIAPMQDKIFKYVERELEDIDESEKWKAPDDDDDPETPLF